MSKSSNPGQLLLYIFAGVLGLTLIIWVLRGVGVLTFIRGSVISGLILLSILTGILSYTFSRARRY